MRIVIVSQDFYPMKGGIASYLLSLYKKYFSNDEVLVIIPSEIGKDEDYESFDFEIFRTKFKPFSLEEERTNESALILGRIKEFQPDLILFGYIRSHPEVGLEYKNLVYEQVKVGLITHAKEVFFEDFNSITSSQKGNHLGYSPQETIFYRNILESMDVVFTVSEFTKKLLNRQKISANTLVLNPPVRCGMLQRFTLDSRVQKKESDIILLSTGRLIKRKGYKAVLKAIYQLVGKYEYLKYYIVGNGPELLDLENKIAKLKLEKNVFIFSDVPDESLGYFYSIADIFILNTSFIPPNDVEGLGIVFLEANFFSLPVIGGKSGGVINAILDNQTGLLIEPDNVDDIASKIEYLINNPQKRKKLGINGYNRVMKEFNEFSEPFIDRFKI